MCHQIVLRPHSHVLKHNVNSVWLFLHSLSTFPCKIHYRIKRVYTGMGNKLQRWGERVIVKRTLPIPALKLTWGLLKLQPDIRLDKDARKGHYVATGDSILLPYFTCPSLVPSFQPWTCQGFSGWVSEGPLGCKWARGPLGPDQLRFHSVAHLSSQLSLSHSHMHAKTTNWALSLPQT